MVTDSFSGDNSFSAASGEASSWRFWSISNSFCGRQLGMSLSIFLVSFLALPLKTQSTSPLETPLDSGSDMVDGTLAAGTWRWFSKKIGSNLWCDVAVNFCQLIIKCGTAIIDTPRHQNEESELKQKVTTETIQPEV